MSSAPKLITIDYTPDLDDEKSQQETIIIDEDDPLLNDTEDIFKYLHDYEHEHEFDDEEEEDESPGSDESIELILPEKHIDPLFDPNNKRLALFPLEFNDIFDFYKRAKGCDWNPEEIDLVTDLKDFTGLKSNEKLYIKTILGFFSGFDFIVNDNLDSFVEDITIPEAKCFFHFQEMMEDKHSHSYSLMLDSYIQDKDEKIKLLNAVVEFPAIQHMADWCKDWTRNGTTIERLIAFACVEGIMFSGAFCAVFWLKKRGIMHGLTYSNELIARDEGLHRDFACLLYNKYIHEKNKLSKEKVIQIVDSCVVLNKQFVCSALPVSLIGMNNELMGKYIEYVADKLLIELIGDKHYNTSNPFDWMELISLESSTNFFERRVSAYGKHAIKASPEENKINFNIAF